MRLRNSVRDRIFACCSAIKMPQLRAQPKVAKTIVRNLRISMFGVLASATSPNIAILVNSRDTFSTLAIWGSGEE